MIQTGLRPARKPGRSRPCPLADESTYKLMVKFFEGVKSGKDKMSALKDAKNHLRTNGYANPFYWAPFILMGEAN
jgi:CHAT domain-containing protein